MAQLPVILRAARVARMASPPIADGAVFLNRGVIADVGPAADVLTRHPDVPVNDLGQSVLLPGLVNPHVHLELSDLTPGEPPWSFVDWLLAVMAKGPPPTPQGEERVARATHSGVEQCLRFGVTTVGDITRFPGVTRRVLADSPLRAVSFGEVTAMASRRDLLEARLAAAMAKSPAPDRIVSAVSPHAPYSIEKAGYERCLAAAKSAGVPIATHLAETADEQTFLTRHDGPFRRLWSTIGGWDEQVPLHPPGTTPEGLMRDIGLLGYERGVIVHANYLHDDVAGSAASVVFCPRTHAYFRHPPHPWPSLLEHGLNVAVGTDSTGSSPDLNLVDDLRLLRRQAPEVPADTLWRMATVNAAKALGMQGKVGVLSVGAAADVTVFDAKTDTPLDEILGDSRRPTQVWIAGRKVYTASTVTS